MRPGCALVAGGLLLAALRVAGAAPNTFNTALPVAKNEFIWREQLLFRDRASDGARDREVSVQALVSVLGYGINSRLAVFGAVPYFFNRELDVTTPVGRVKRDTSGFGDATLFARYTAYRHDFTGGTFRVGALAGVGAPTGNDNDRDALGRLPRPLQTGDGAWDGFAGAVLTWQTLQYELDAQVLYRGNGRHDGYAAGDEVRLDTSLQYRIWPREFTSGTPGFVYALLESSLVHRDQDELAGGTDADSGGTQWLLAPGLQFVGRRWIFEGTVQLPAASNPHGNALEDDRIVRFGFRRNF